jgi:hypothetical protein
VNAPVLTDLAGRNFTEGDFVVYSSTNGIRYGKVDWIKDVTHPDPRINGGQKRYKVYVDLAFHRALTKEPGKMYAKRMGYEYMAQHFLKVSELTST